MLQMMVFLMDIPKQLMLPINRIRNQENGLNDLQIVFSIYAKNHIQTSKMCRVFIDWKDN
jgi:hypothetical protein